MGTMRRGSAGMSARWGWERHSADWQIIPTRRRLFLPSRMSAIRSVAVLRWLCVLSVAVAAGGVLLHRFW